MPNTLTDLEKKFQTGLILLREGKVQKAEKILGEMLKHMPDNPALLERLGYCSALQQNWSKAEHYYLRASGLQPDSTEILNNYGCVLQKQERWDEALPLFRRAFAADPQNINALGNLAQSLNHCQQYEEAVACYKTAIEQQPDNNSIRFQLAEILHEQSRYEEEITQYQSLLSRDSGNIKARIRLALALFACNAEEEAGNIINSLECARDAVIVTLFEGARQAQEQEKFREAANYVGLLTKLVPESLQFWKTYTVNLYFAYGLEKSLPVFEKAISQFPEEPSFLRALAIAYAQSGQFDKSVEIAGKLVELTPEDPKSHQTYATVLRQYQKAFSLQQLPDEVCKHFLKAIELAQYSPEILESLAQSLVETKEPAIMGKCLDSLPENLDDSFLYHLLQNFLCAEKKQFDKAMYHGSKCHELSPENSFALSELAETCFYMEKYDEALKYARKAIKVNPKDSQARMRLGHLAVDCGRVDEGLEISEQAHALNPHDPSIMLSLGLINLLVKNWDRGWQMYEARYRLQNKHRVDIPPVPRWDGKPSENLELILISEQGLGDIIQFSRFIPLAAKCAGKTIFIANPSLAHMFRHYSDIVDIIPAKSGFTVNAEKARWISLVDIPRTLNIPETEWGNSVPYLAAEKHRIDQWSPVINGLEGYLKIGIAWQGSPGARLDVGRSIPLRHFEPLSRIPGVNLISLQKHHGEEQIGQVTFSGKITCLGENFDTGTDAFADTAAVMHLLDLVITSDTSIAHLAGAMGRPVWLALKHVPDWRWHLHTPDTPWYPTMRLFRQKTPGDWLPVFRSIADTLRLEKSSVRGQNLVKH